MNGSGMKEGRLNGGFQTDLFDVRRVRGSKPHATF